ncbi:hypothetical protein EIMP300_86850 [Escherichia coli]|uniref:Uncharacterized protein n=1 Tax=Escherichia coli TaxID=562 RepID=A0A8S0G2A1_ECOLX|nr:hypothetical protein EIMP300_86850 [Escherichia coli]
MLLSRWLLTRPQFLILDEPTRGIDVGAHAEIIRLIETLCADGLALLVISSELEELVGYADRVIIMRDRKQVAEIPLAEPAGSPPPVCDPSFRSGDHERHCGVRRTV